MRQLAIDFDAPAPVFARLADELARADDLDDDALSDDALNAAAEPPGPYEEVESLIAEAAAIEARIEAGGATADDRAALRRIGGRADALGFINLGTHADGLVDWLERQGM